MAGLNKVLLIGHLGRAPESRPRRDGGSVVTFSLATSETWRDKASGERREITDWHTIVIFNEALGKVATEHLKKGSKVWLEGQIKTRKWQDREGRDRYVTEIVLADFRGSLVLLDRVDRAPGAEEAAYGSAAPLDDDIPY